MGCTAVNHLNSGQAGWKVMGGSHATYAPALEMNFKVPKEGNWVPEL